MYTPSLCPLCPLTHDAFNLNKRCFYSLGKEGGGGVLLQRDLRALTDKIQTEFYFCIYNLDVSRFQRSAYLPPC